jgi:hypothetical protein
MFSKVTKHALAVAAIMGAMSIAVASPASAFPFSDADQGGWYSQGAYTPRHHASRRYTPRHHASFNYTPRPYDGGGNVFSYYGRMYNSHGERIAGDCVSACTMKLGARNACVERGATLMFHQASVDGARSELATRMMLYSYPARIRQWVLRTGALNRSSLTALSGSQAIALGMRAC